MDNENLYARFAAAYVRGEALRARENGGRVDSDDSEIRGKPLSLSEELLKTPLDALTESEIAAILAAGREAGLKLYRFKNTHAQLPRVRRALSYLKGQAFSSLLDIGSGRGVFLWPFLDEFPWVETASLDLLSYRAAFLQRVTSGGVTRLAARQGDLTACPEIPDQSVDFVTMLEVLEHIPDTAAALRSAVRVARKGLVISVPNQPDNNPEHIHLFTRQTMTDCLHAAGCTRLSFDAVPGHMLVFARMER